ncbi:MAG TPA: response regulator [Flavisolibacter sp.]|jgi:CheY-like chemotaxis protein|nr:response regulator [Flavisolibacter sp.]
MPQNPLNIAMLEDDSDDRYLTEESVATTGFHIEIIFFSNSEHLFHSLLTQKPHLILIDFNSTPDNGIQVIKKLKADIHLRHIPVVIISDSNLPKYKKECYAAGASVFATKPRNMLQTRQKIETFFKFWIEVAEL